MKVIIEIAVDVNDRITDEEIEELYRHKIKKWNNNKIFNINSIIDIGDIKVTVERDRNNGK